MVYAGILDIFHGVDIWRSAFIGSDCTTEMRSDDFDGQRKCICCFHAKMWHCKSGCKFDYPCKCAGFAEWKVYS